MSNGFMNRLKNWVAGDPFEDDIYALEEDYETETHVYQPARRPEYEGMNVEPKKQKNNLKVLDHSKNAATQVVVIEPKAFEESLEIIEHLREKKSVILNLQLLDTSQSQRIVDFLSGATQAIDGHQQRIGDSVFIFTPNNVMVSSEETKGLALSEAFWSRG